MPASVLASRFALGKDAILRHARNHLSPVQRASILAASKPTSIDPEELAASEGRGLLASLVVQRGRLQRHAELAAELGDIRGAVSAEGAITANLALVGKLIGMLVQRHDVRHSSVLLSPDYIRLRSVLVQALKPFPQASQAVARALYELELSAAKVIEQAAKPPLVIEHTPTVPAPLPFRHRHADRARPIAGT